MTIQTTILSIFVLELLIVYVHAGPGWAINSRVRIVNVIRSNIPSMLDNVKQLPIKSFSGLCTFKLQTTSPECINKI